MDLTKTKDLDLFRCPAPEFGNCLISKRACALRHTARVYLQGTHGAASTPAGMGTCRACLIGAQNAKNLDVKIHAVGKSHGFQNRGVKR